MLIIQLILFPSCSKLISDEFPDYDQVPALNGILVADKPLQVQLSMAQKVDTTKIFLVEDASVWISGHNFPEFELPHLFKGMYKTYDLVVPGEIYCCEAVVKDFEPLYASDTVPLPVDVEIVWQSNQSRFDEEGNYMEGIEIEFMDDPTTTDFYEVVVSKRKNENIYNVWAFDENSPILLNEGLDPFSTETLVFSDLLMDSSLMRMKLDLGTGTQLECYADSCVQIFVEHTLFVELRHVSRAYYDFKKSYYIYLKSRYPMFVEGTTTAISVYSNIENGHGIFASYTTSMDSIFVEEEHIPR